MRDERRPEIADVVRVFDAIFERFRDESDFRQVDRGPQTWTWVDATAAHLGYEKWFVLTSSAMPGVEGYPLLTVRQSVAPRLDAWVTVSSLVMGPSDREIESSLAMAIANHMGAFAGLRQSVNTVIETLSGKSVEEALDDFVPGINDLTEKKEMN